jgi:uncharacterized membrane protein YfcA
MAGVGHISVFGFGGYAKGFKSTAPELNKLVTDSIRTSNQWLVGLSALISSWNYYRMGRLVLPLAVALGIGSIIGSYSSVSLSAGKVSFSAYQGYFGLFVLVLGCYLFLRDHPGRPGKQEKSQRGGQGLREHGQEAARRGAGDTKALGVKTTSFSLTRISFTFYGVEFSFNPIIPCSAASSFPP